MWVAKCWCGCNSMRSKAESKETTAGATGWPLKDTGWLIGRRGCNNRPRLVKPIVTTRQRSIRSTAGAQRQSCPEITKAVPGKPLTSVALSWPNAPAGDRCSQCAVHRVFGRTAQRPPPNANSPPKMPLSGPNVQGETKIAPRGWGGGGGRRPISNPPPSLSAGEGLRAGGALPAVPRGGGRPQTSTAQNDPQVALIILSTDLWWWWGGGGGGAEKLC